MKVAVLLATFNGERYISEQLDSLIRQSFKDFVVYYHDDGSTDSTLSILHEYSTKYEGKFVEIISSFHQGPKINFMSLLEFVDADYYLFCDQDDVWKNDKIEKTLQRMHEVERQCINKPILIHTDLEVVDA